MTQQANEWDLLIEPKKKLLSIDFAEIWRYRDLYKQYVKRDIVTVYKQTIFGPLWFFFSPIFTTIMYMFVFNSLAGISTGDIPPAVFYMSGNILWGYFAACFSTGQTAFTANQGVFSKVYFPRLVAPLSGITSSFIKTMIQVLPLIFIYAYYVMHGVPLHFTWEALFLPVIIFLIALMGLGFGLIVSALTVKYRDLNNLVAFGLQLWMYATPVIYPVDITSNPKLSLVLKLNPLQSIFTDTRYMITGMGSMDWAGLLYTAIFTITILFLGVIVFNRQERTFMDTI
jgi:lipopolysaccharide transport system permease protein